jgi:diguanylate cyclase (GGDEF)-like protein
MDRRLVVSVLAAVTALAAGVVGAVLGRAELSVLAGAAGVMAGIAAASIAAHGRHREDQVQELHRKLDALTATLTEEAKLQEPGPFDELEAAPPGIASEPMPPAPDDAIDGVTGLLEEKFFSVLVYQRVAAARRSLQPVSLILFEIDGMRDADAHAQDEALGVLGEVVRATFRECDTSCRAGATGVGSVLENTAEAGAVWAVERVRGVLMASPIGQNLTISAAVACYPSHALSAAELLERLDQALNVARGRGRDHVEVARLD